MNVLLTFSGLQHLAPTVDAVCPPNCLCPLRAIEAWQTILRVAKLLTEYIYIYIGQGCGLVGLALDRAKKRHLQYNRAKFFDSAD
jgi:hypothetical protein